MNYRRIAVTLATLFGALTSCLNTAHAQGTAFTYQGRLSNGGSPISGSYDLSFTLYSDASTAVVLKGPVTNSAVAVTDGLLTTLVDFGPGVFVGGSNWLGIAVSPTGSNSFALLSPRQQVTPTPYALNVVGPVNTSQLSGSIPATSIGGVLTLAQLPSGVVTNGSPSLTIGGTNQVAPLTLPPKVPVASVGSVSTDGGPTFVAVAGRYAYVVSLEAKTLQVFDVSNPAGPTNVGTVPTGSGPLSVAVAGRYAYIANAIDNTLQVFDVGNPSAPASVGLVSTGYQPHSVAIAGRYAYVVNYGTSTLQVFDVGNPSAPAGVGLVSTAGGPYSVVVAGRYAYVANAGANALQVYDVSNPAAPVSVGLASAGSEPLSVAVAGRYAYVANAYDNTLQVFDVSNPSAPSSVGSAPSGLQPSSVAVAGRFAYVADQGANSLQVFDVNNPSAPNSVGSVSTGNGPTSVAVAGRYAYVVNQNTSTLQVFDLGGAYLQQLEAGTMETGTLQTRDTATVGNNLDVRGGLSVSGSARISGGLGVDSIHASAISAGSISGSGAGLSNIPASAIAGVVTNGAAGLTIGGTNQVAPLTLPPTIPVGAVGSVPTGVQPISVAVAGRYAYVADQGANSLQVFDVSNPSAPNRVGSVSTASRPTSVAVAGRYAYVANAGANLLQVYDVSNPAAPVTVGLARAGSEPLSVAVAGRFAYVADQGANTLQVFDVSNPSAPSSVGSAPTGLQPISIAVAGRYAYVVNNAANTLQVFDVGNPSAPVSVGSVATGNGPTSVAVAGRYAYVLGGGFGAPGFLQVFDVSNPAAPSTVGSAQTGSNPLSVAVAGRYAYVLGGGLGAPGFLQVFDVSNPSAPSSVGSAPTGLQPFSVAVAGRYAYVANYGANTLQVFDLGGAYLQELEAGAIETGTLQTRDTATVGNNLDVRGGLTVSGSARISGGLGVDSISGNGAGLTGVALLNGINTFNGNQIINNNGRIGIGTSSPSAPLDVEIVASADHGFWGYLALSGYANNNRLGYNGSPNLAIYTPSAMGAATYYAFSDARIKNISGVSDSAADLKSLLGIQVTDYTYKDTVAHGPRPAKKVVAQQVESVYPQAVSRTTGVIPDIYQQVSHHDGWIPLEANLKVGERVKLIGEGDQGIYEVLETRDGAFRTAFRPATEKVFVYGREVQDFRNVDYEALAMLNVSATQELAHQLEALRACLKNRKWLGIRPSGGA